MNGRALCMGRRGDARQREKLEEKGTMKAMKQTFYIFTILLESSEVLH